MFFNKRESRHKIYIKMFNELNIQRTISPQQMVKYIFTQRQKSLQDKARGHSSSQPPKNLTIQQRQINKTKVASDIRREVCGN